MDEAAENARAAGVADLVAFESGDALELAPRAGWNAWIVSNPPYGERVGDERELGSLYQRFATLLRERCQGYHYAILSGNPLLSRALAPLSPRRIPLKNGPLECELLHGSIGSS